MVLVCDICRQEVSQAGGQNPTICLFPCFHKYCERCKIQQLNAARTNVGNEVACKLCNQHFQLDFLYDYSENPIEKTFCLHCNIKNKATVEWRCKTCQNRYLCATCAQPHLQSGHEIEPMMKQSIPARSQCSTHNNVPATHLCSCKARLCDYCLNVHANGQFIHPHEQRLPYTHLAQQARSDLDNIRRNSKNDTDRLNRLKETISKNKQLIHNQVSQARTAVANEVLELVNAVIRRGNDIVNYLDIVEETKLKQSTQVEHDMRHWLDKLRKIESFAENAMLTVQQDHPGMCSAAMFAQNSLMQVNKRYQSTKAAIRVLEQAPNIQYKADLTELKNAIRSFGSVSVAGETKVPPQSTPQNARMFTIANSAQLNPSPSTSTNIVNGQNAQSGSTATSLATARQSQQNAPLMTRPTLPQTAAVPPGAIVSSTGGVQQPQMNVSIRMSSVPAQKQQGALNTSAPVQRTTMPATAAVAPTLQTQQQQQNRVLPQLLQQPSTVMTSSFPPPCSVPLQNASLPNTPITPLPTPEQLHIMRQNANAMMVAAQQQQSQMPSNQMIQLQQSQQAQAMLQQQQMAQKQQQALQQQRAAAINKQQQKQQLQQQQLRSPPVVGSPQQQQQQQLLLQQQVQRVVAHQQQEQMRLQQNAGMMQQQMVQRQQQMMQQQMQMHQRMNHPNQNVSSQVMPGACMQQPSMLIRYPNPRQQMPIQQNMCPASTANPCAIATIPQRMNTPPQNAITQVPNTCLPTASAVQPPSQSSNVAVASLNQQQNFGVSRSAGQTSNASQQIPHGSQPENVQQGSSFVVELDDEDSNDQIVKTPATLVVQDEDNDGEHQSAELQSSSAKNPANQTTSTSVISAVRQKAQSAAADSTVNGSNGRDSVSPNTSPSSSAKPAHIGIGLKRKTPEHANLEPMQKRQAIVEQNAVAEQIVANEDTERANKNTSPVVISTTTTENGEAVVINNNNNELEEGEIVDESDEQNETQTHHLMENSSNKESTSTSIGTQEKNGIQHMGQVQTAKQNETTNNHDQQLVEQHAGSSKTPRNGESCTNLDKNQQQQTPNKTPTTKCAVVSPMQLMKMTKHVEEATMSNSSKQTEKQQPRNGADTSGSGATPSTNAEANGDKTNSKKQHEREVGNPQPDGRLRGGGDDFWDDYCFVCSQGCDETTGSLGCCDNCPHVFHANCHVPNIDGLMEDLPDDWRCAICLPCEPLNQQSQQFGERERLLCAKVYLACFEGNANQVELFLHEVPITETDYYSVIKHPIWFSAIAEKISKRRYERVTQFVDDMNLMFRNFSTFHPANIPLANCGKSVYTRFVGAIRTHLPAYQNQIWLYVSLYNARQSSSSISTDDDAGNTHHQKRGGGARGRPRGRGTCKAKSQTPA